MQILEKMITVITTIVILILFHCLFYCFLNAMSKLLGSV